MATRPTSPLRRPSKRTDRRSSAKETGGQRKREERPADSANARKGRRTANPRKAPTEENLGRRCGAEKDEKDDKKRAPHTMKVCGARGFRQIRSLGVNLSAANEQPFE